MISKTGHSRTDSAPSNKTRQIPRSRHLPTVPKSSGKKPRLKGKNTAVKPVIRGSAGNFCLSRRWITSMISGLPDARNVAYPWKLTEPRKPPRHFDTKSLKSRSLNLSKPNIAVTKLSAPVVAGPCLNARASSPRQLWSRSPRHHRLSGFIHLGTRRGVCEIMSTLFGIDISLGSVCNILARVTGELEPVVDEIRQTLPNAQNLNIDETGWKSKGERRTLWVFLSSVAVYFCVAASRGSCVLSSVLGEAFAGIITSDDHSAYSSYHRNGLRQLCWAHLIRKFKALEEISGSPDARRFATCMLNEIEKLFTCWYAFLDEALTREELRQSSALIRGRMKRLCRHYQSSSDTAVATRACRTLKNWNHLFTFIFHEGVRPTNNAAERALRFAVQWRKICFGSQSPSGERFTERSLTVTRTCRLQNRNPFHFLAQVMTAAFAGSPHPTLV